MARPPRLPPQDDRLLDSETWETPRRLSRAETRQVAGLDGRWTPTELETPDDD